MTTRPQWQFNNKQHMHLTLAYWFQWLDNQSSVLWRLLFWWQESHLISKKSPDPKKFTFVGPGQTLSNPGKTGQFNDEDENSFTSAEWPTQLIATKYLRAAPEKHLQLRTSHCVMTRSSATAEKQRISCACLPRLANWSCNAQNTAESQRLYYFWHSNALIQELLAENAFIFCHEIATQGHSFCNQLPVDKG